MTDAIDARAEANREALDTEHLMGDLGRRAAQGGVIAVAGRVASLVVGLAASVILARLLRPEDFGLLAMATTVIGLTGLFTDLGLSSAAVQRERLDQNTASGLFHVNVAMGFAVMLATMGAAPVAAWVFNDNRVLWILVALAPTILIGAANAQHTAILVRRMQWMTLQWMALAAQVVAGAAAILLAWKTDVGYWALVAQGWISAVFSLVLTWRVSRWRPSRVTDWTGTRESLNFGANLTGFYFLNYLHLQFDNALIGWRWGAAELGFYARAYSLFQMPLTVVTWPMMGPMLTAMSRAQNDQERWKHLYISFLAPLVCVTAPLSALLFLLARPLIITLYGSDWAPVAPIFQALALSILVQPIYSSGGLLFMSLGRTDRKFKGALVGTAWFVGAYVIGLPYRGEGVALAYAFAMLLWVPAWLWWATRDTSLKVRTIAAAIWPPITAACAGLAAAYLAGAERPETMYDVGETTAVFLTTYAAVAVVAFLTNGRWRKTLDPAMRLASNALLALYRRFSRRDS